MLSRYILGYIKVPSHILFLLEAVPIYAVIEPAATFSHAAFLDTVTTLPHLTCKETLMLSDTRTSKETGKASFPKLVKLTPPSPFDLFLLEFETSLKQFAHQK